MCFASMSLFGQTSFGGASAFGGGAATSTLATAGAAAAGATAAAVNPMKDLEVVSAPDDSVSCLRFSPAQASVGASNFLVAGSWDNNVRCWEIKGNGQSEPKTQQSMQVIKQPFYYAFASCV